MNKNFTNLSFIAIIVFSLLSITNLKAQECWPATPATVVGTADANVSLTHTFSDVPVGSVIEIITAGPDDVFNVSWCATNASGWMDGDHDCSTHILDANGPAANYLANIEDGCPDFAPGQEGWGPDIGAWGASAMGTYYIYITEWNAAGNDNCTTDSGNVYELEINITSPGPCDAGMLTVEDQTVCPAQPFQIATDGMEVSDGGFEIGFDNTNTGGTGGLGGAFRLINLGDNPFPRNYDADLNGILSTNSYPPFSGTWEMKLFALDAAGADCDSTDIITLTFLPSSDPSCSDCTVVVPGALTNNSLICTDDSFTISTDGTNNAPGGYQLVVDNTNTGGTGGTGAPLAIGGYYDWDIPLTSDSDLSGLLSANSVPPLDGSWEIWLYALNGNGEICDSTSVTQVTFNGMINAITLTSSSNEICGNGMGSATVNSMGATSYMWSNGDSGDMAMGLSMGTHTVTVTDGNGCTGTAEVTIGDDPSPITLTTSSVGEDCSAANGSAEVIAANGDGNYIYSWSNGQNGATATGLSAGSITVIVSDGNGCTAMTTVGIPSIGGPNVSTQAFMDASCSDSEDGFIEILVGGGATPYTYQWSNGGTNRNVYDLLADTYTCIVTDDNMCSFEYTFTINAPDAVTASVENLTNVSCNGGMNGVIGIDVMGGDGTYTFSWTGPDGFTSMDQNISGLAAGTYVGVITDGAGCSTQTTLGIAEPSAVSIATVSTTDVSCKDGADGAIEISASGGQGTFTVMWDNGESTESISGLAAGDYTAVVTDGTGCTAETTISISEPTDAVEATVDEIYGSNGSDNNGAVEITVAGGTAPYTYSWTGPNGYTSTDEDPIGMGPGDYTGVITDANGCEFTAGPISVWDFLSAENIEQVTAFTLNPNPTTGWVRIQMDLNAAYDVSVSIYDVTGKEITTAARNNTNQAIFDLDLNTATNGVYFAKIVVDGAVFTERIVIAK